MCRGGESGANIAAVRVWKDWIGGRYQRVTARFARACEVLLKSTSVQAVAAFHGLNWHTVKSIDKASLRASIAEPDWTQVRYLAMDEFVCSAQRPPPCDGGD